MPIIPNDTVSSILDLINRANPVSVIQPPLSRAHFALDAFALDASGVAGVFGGDTAVRAMATIYLIPQRRWLGWYNAPGAYEVAKQYSGIGKSYIFDALFPSGDGDPGKIFTVVDRQVDLKYTPLHSITGQGPLSIGPLGLLFVRKVFQMPITNNFPPQTNHAMDSPPQTNHAMDRFRIMFVALNRHVPGPRSKLYSFPSKSNIFVIAMILISVGGCVTCALVGDWFCFASIAIGIIANGIGCLVIGSGELDLMYENLTQDKANTPGDILLNADTDIIALLGTESRVSPLIRGRFTLSLRRILGSASNARAVKSRSCKWEIPMEYLIHISVFLLLFQFLAQLLLIPQGTLFGQLMFIGTLVSSWVYHLYLSTLRLDLQTQALFRKLSIDPKKDIYQNTFSTRTEAAVFACLAFRSIHLLRLNLDLMEEMAEESQHPDDAHREEAEEEAEKVHTAFTTLLFTLLPGETVVGQAFRQSLVRKMSRPAIIAYARDNNPSFKFDDQDAVMETDKGEIRLNYNNKRELERYQRDAQQALDKWRSGFWGKKEMQRLA